MKKLHEITKEIAEWKSKRAMLVKENTKALANIDSLLSELTRLENAATDCELDIEKIQMAEKVLEFQGNPDNVCEGEKLTDLAAIDIANGHPHLSKRYFGNKRYEGFYQRNDTEYGYGPRHGYIVDRIGMKHESRGQVLCDEEKDACIYYLKNYSKIKQLTQPA